VTTGEVTPIATRRVARHADVAAVLDSPEVAALIRDIEGLKLRKRRGYGTRTLIGACLVRTIYALPTWTRTVRLIEEHAGLAEAIGGTPSEWACYRFMAKLREHAAALAACVDRLAESLRAEHPDMGVEVAIDASDLPAYANGQRYVSKGGRERERFSDPDASWGHRSAVSTRKGGGFYGYRLHLATCTRTGLPLAWQVETARNHESRYVAPLLDAIRGRGFEPETCAMDKGYDNTRVMAETRERGCVPIVSLRKTSPIPLDRIPYGSDEWKRLYRGRAAVEREFGRLKNEYGLTPLRTRTLARVRIHADLTLLSRLSVALARARVASLAA
jgi:Transposase DDE domain